MEMWNAYPTFRILQHDLLFNSKGEADPVNQCAIRFSDMLLNMRLAQFFESVFDGPTRNGYGLRASDMADWANTVFGSFTTLHGPNIADQLKDRIGIVFLRDFPGADQGASKHRFNHIDLWNGFAYRLGSTPDSRYINGPRNWFDNAAEVRFWEFK